MPIYACPRCPGSVLPEIDEYHERRHVCVNCGHEVTNRERGQAMYDADHTMWPKDGGAPKPKKRRRPTSSKGVRLS